MEAERVAADIERELKQAAEALGFFDRQVPPGRGPIVTDEVAETDVCFKIREAATLPDGRPEAYVSLRERRTMSVPNRPAMYWYGLVEQLETGDWLYEGFHCHDDNKLAGSFQQTCPAENAEDGGPVVNFKHRME